MSQPSTKTAYILTRTDATLSIQSTTSSQFLHWYGQWQ